jgi:hypothetical protein
MAGIRRFDAAIRRFDAVFPERNRSPNILFGGHLEFAIEAKYKGPNGNQGGPRHAKTRHDPRHSDDIHRAGHGRRPRRTGSAVRGRFPVDGVEFLILWEGFQAQAGEGIPLREQRKNCQLNLDLAYPAGWQYTVESTSYQGTVQVAEGTQAIVSSYYYFQGSDEQVDFSTTFTNPRRRTFRVTDSVADDEQVWSSCTADRSLNINYAVRVSAVTDGQATGKIAFGVERDGDPAGTLLKLKWRRCE